MERPIVIYTVVYIALFVSHIVAAANDWNILFRVIASVITIQTFFAGLILHKLGGNALHARIPVILLGAGLGYVYSGMNIRLEIIFFIIFAIILQYGTEKGLKYGELAENNNG